MMTQAVLPLITSRGAIWPQHALDHAVGISYDASHKVVTRVTSLSLVLYRNKDYSVPTRFGHREILVKGYVERVEFACAAQIIAVHARF